MQYRQGDILIETAPIPKGAKQIKVERVVLAEGEATGHAHELSPDLVDVYEIAQTRHYQVNKPAPVQHQEHDVFSIPIESYIVIPQREYHPERIRRVQD